MSPSGWQGSIRLDNTKPGAPLRYICAYTTPLVVCGATVCPSLQHLSFLATNLAYEHELGRLQVLDMLNQVRSPCLSNVRDELSAYSRCKE